MTETPYSLIRLIHYGFSIAFIIVGITSIVNAIVKQKRDVNYTQKDRLLSFSFIGLLYTQAVFGIYMFFTRTQGSEIDPNDLQALLEANKNRFWPTEHFVMMLFAILIAHLGVLFVKNTQDHSSKFRKIRNYFSLSFLLILISLFTAIF